jgi:hypothetical protein
MGRQYSTPPSTVAFRTISRILSTEASTRAGGDNGYRGSFTIVATETTLLDVNLEKQQGAIPMSLTRVLVVLAAMISLSAVSSRPRSGSGDLGDLGEFRSIEDRRPARCRRCGRA